MSQVSDKALHLIVDIDDFVKKHPKMSRSRLFRAAEVADASYGQWHSGLHAPSDRVEKRIREAMRDYSAVYDSFDSSPPVPPENMIVPVESLRDYARKYISRENISIKDFHEQLNEYAEDRELSYGAVYDFVKKRTNPHERTYNALVDLLRNKGFITRLNLPKDPSIQMKAEPDKVDNEFLNKMGFKNTSSKGDEALDALQDDRERANIIAMIVTCTFVNETTKRGLLGSLFPAVFPELSKSLPKPTNE